MENDIVKAYRFKPYTFCFHCVNRKCHNFFSISKLINFNRENCVTGKKNRIVVLSLCLCEPYKRRNFHLIKLLFTHTHTQTHFHFISIKVFFLKESLVLFYIFYLFYYYFFCVLLHLHRLYASVCYRTTPHTHKHTFSYYYTLRYGAPETFRHHKTK